MNYCPTIRGSILVCAGSASRPTGSTTSKRALVECWRGGLAGDPYSDVALPAGAEHLDDAARVELLAAAARSIAGDFAELGVTREEALVQLAHCDSGIYRAAARATLREMGIPLRDKPDGE